MILPTVDQEVESCVYKLFYGEKYIIVKGKTLSGSIYFILTNGYSKFLAAGGGRGNKNGGTGQKEWEDNNNFYKKFYTWIKRNNLSFKIEILLETNNPYQLLKAEQVALNMSIKDKNCLNNNVTSYIPKFREKTGMYGWIPKKDIASFRRFLSKR
jgi:hypothetical protein